MTERRNSPDRSGPARRVPLEREVSLKFKEFRGFITEVSANISVGGMFIRTDEPKAPGSVFDFELTLTDETTLVQGIGEVAWVRESAIGPEKPAGMGVRFLHLDDASRELVDRMVAEHEREGGTRFDVEAEMPADDANPAAEPELPPTKIEPATRAQDASLPPLQSLAAFSVGDGSPPPLRPIGDGESSRSDEPDLLLVEPVVDDGVEIEVETIDEPLSAEADEAFGVVAHEPDWTPAPAPLLPEDGAAESDTAIPEIEVALEPADVTPTAPSAASTPPRVIADPVPSYSPPPSTGTIEMPEDIEADHYESPSDSRGSRLTPILVGVGVGVVVLAAVAYVTGLVPGSPSAVSAPERAPEAVSDDSAPSPAPVEDGSQPIVASTAEATEDAGQPDPSASPASEPPTGEVGSAEIAVAEPTTPMTRIEEISFESGGSGTVVTIQTDGRVDESRFATYEMGGASPRLLLKLFQVAEPYRSNEISVGSDEVSRIRTGYHPGQELHVVIDLASSGLTPSVEASAGRLLITFGR